MALGVKPTPLRKWKNEKNMTFGICKTGRCGGCKNIFEGIYIRL
jgi:hypothetical protein